MIMKRLVLLFTGLLIGLTTASATELNHPKKHHKAKINKAFKHAEPIVFVERDVTFFVFPDGSFDFKANNKTKYFNNKYYTNNTRIRNISRNRSVNISHDRFGNIKRIGNMPLNYDRQGKITRIGSVFMDYKHGNNTLKQVGGLSVHYNHWGKIVKTRGYVNHFNKHNNRIAYFDNVRHSNDNDYYFKQKKIKR